jgi:hypothetical protein
MSKPRPKGCSFENVAAFFCVHAEKNPLSCRRFYFYVDILVAAPQETARHYHGGNDRDNNQ